jgi:Tfp pilus assembly ATPase PilU
MPSLSEDQARSYVVKLLTAMSSAGGSDLFISKDFPASMKLQGAMQPLTNQRLSGELARDLAYALMNQRQREEFERELECNFAISIPNVARFRVSVFVQQQNVGMVVRTIANEIPNFSKLGLPETLKDIVMTKRGLVLVVGATGSGKSTTLLKGEFHEIKPIMQKSRELGMSTFDQSLFDLYNDGAIAYDEAIRNADSANELRLNIKLNSTRKEKELSVTA